MADALDGFETARGSKYTRYSDTTTQRDRSGTGHKDTSTGMQPRSGKTVYMEPQHIGQIGGFFQNPDMGTQLTPDIIDGKPAGTASLKLTDDYGPLKAGKTLATVPYTTEPKVGMHPVEIYKSQSPLNDAGKGIHFGSKITKLLKNLPVVGTAAGLALANSPSEAAESLLPLWMTPSEAYKKGGKIKLPKGYKKGGGSSLI
jgi:hypothetical protein